MKRYDPHIANYVDEEYFSQPSENPKSDKNIFERLSAISQDLEVVNKSFMVEVSKGKGYKAVSEADILSAVRPLEAKYGIYSYPCKRKVIDSQIIKVSDAEGKQKITYFERIETTYRFVNVDAPAEFIEVISYGDGLDNGDKSVGKAMTYADKYALMKAYKIITGEDPDKEASKITYDSPNKKKEEEEIKFATEKQLSLIANLIEEKSVDKKLIKMQFNYAPDDKKMPLKVAFEMITYLRELDMEDMPF